jgi:predicted DNA-binding transcriptional regulator AlpA
MNISPPALVAEQGDEPKLLLKKEVLAITRVTFVTIWTWVQQGKFPAPVEVGGRSMWIASEVYEWVRNRPRRVYGAKIRAGKS